MATMNSVDDNCWVCVEMVGNETSPYTAVIPTNWFSSEKKTFCWYPPARENPSLKAVKRHAPQKHWQEFRVTKVFKPTFDSFSKARLKLAKTSENSDLTSDQEEGRGRRLKKKNSKYDSDVGSNNDETDEDWLGNDPFADSNDSETQFSIASSPIKENLKESSERNILSSINLNQCVPPPTKCLGLSKENVSSRRQECNRALTEEKSCATESHKRLTFSESPIKPPVFKAGIATSTQKPYGEKCRNVEQENLTNENVQSLRAMSHKDRPRTNQLKSSNTAYMLKILENQQSMMASIAKLIRRVESLSLIVEDQVSSANGKSSEMSNSVFLDENFKNFWPVDSHHKLLNVHSEIEKSPEFKNKIITLASKQTGKNCQLFVNKMMELFISDEFAVSFSWQGRGEGNEEFKKLPLAQLLKSVALSVNSADSEQSIETALSNWFRFANARIQRRRKSFEKKSISNK